MYTFTITWDDGRQDDSITADTIVRRNNDYVFHSGGQPIAWVPDLNVRTIRRSPTATATPDA